VFGGAIAAERAAHRTFSGGLHPTTAWKYPNVLRPDQRADASEAIKKLSGAVHAGDPVILEAGMEVIPVGINPDDAQLLESRGFGVEEVCRWFRVPPWMVGHTEKSTSWGTGIEQQMIGFLTFTLGPWLRRIEQAISKDLLRPAERSRYYPKFAVEGLLRADSAARSTFYAAMVNNGIFTRDEVRELEDREPMGGNAAVLTVQTALAPLDTLGKVDDAGKARAALMSWLREPEPPEQG
jgi:HK97 family phage portal protein